MARVTNCTINGQAYYRLTATIGHKQNSKGKIVPVRKDFYGTCKKDAEAKRDAYIEKAKAGLETKTQYFGVLADSWISEFFIHDGSLKDSTKARYIAAWNRSIRKLDLYHQELDQVTAKTLQKAYNELRSSGTPVSEIKTIHKLMRKFYRYIDFNRLGHDITGSLTLPKEKVNAAGDGITVWTDEEIRKIMTGFEKADNRFRLRFLLVLAYYTGCRKSELLALKYEDITSEGVHVSKQLAEVSEGMKDGKMKTRIAVTDPKTKKSVRTIPVDPIVLAELKIHKAWHKAEQLKNNYRTEYIFTTDSGAFYNNKNLDRALERYFKKIGVEPKTMHTFRHTYASNLCRSGVPIQVASALLGHDSIETTARFYVSVDAASKNDAALKLRQFLAGNITSA